MDRLPAAILVLNDRPYPAKQLALAVQYAEDNRLRVITICYAWPDCFTMVVNRHVAVIVAAVDPGERPREAIEQVGGKLLVVRPERRTDDRVRHRIDVSRAARNLHKLGMSTQEIAAALEVNSGEIRRSLRRFRPPGT